MSFMKTVGIGKLQKNASAVIRDVKAGETVEITVRGQVVARILPEIGALPASMSKLDRLIAAGLAHGDGRGFRDAIRRFPPQPLGPGEYSPSDMLRDLRADER